MLTQTITLSFSLSATFNSLWKRQVQTLIEPEPDLAPALSVRPAVLSNPQRSINVQPTSPAIHPSSGPAEQPGQQQPVKQAFTQRAEGAARFVSPPPSWPLILARFTGLIGGGPQRGIAQAVPSPITARLMPVALTGGTRGGGGDPKLQPFFLSLLHC